MAESAIGLEEIVVTGMEPRKERYYRLCSFSFERTNNRPPVNNIFQALQGKAAGVDITTSLRPGTLEAFHPRARSLTASNSPLYVVDGIPFCRFRIETLNEQDIQSIEILKDASATAIYGSHALTELCL